MRHHKRFSPLAVIVLAAAMILVIGLICTTYADSGKDGNITWNYDESTKTLTVGVLDPSAEATECYLNYDMELAPWAAHRTAIKKIVISDGITYIGQSVFRNYGNLVEVDLPSSVDSIASRAFQDNFNLEIVKHPTGECELAGNFDEDGESYGPFDGCNDTILTFSIPEDPDSVSELAEACKQNGYRIKGQRGSLKGAYVFENWDGDDPMEEEPTDGYSYYAKQKWDGKAWTARTKYAVPKVSLYGHLLTYGEDYTCFWGKSTSVGRYVVNIEGVGEYCDSAITFCVICPKSTSISKLTAGKKQLTVKWLKQSRKMSKKTITGYEIEVAENKAFTKGVKTKRVKGYSKISATFKKLKSKTYYVRVRTYMTASGCDIPSTWSPVKKIKVK